MRNKREIEIIINSYQSLYQSAIAYSIRTYLIVKSIVKLEWTKENDNERENR